ncbi:MAG: hypothetical protein K6B44_11435 [Lachnospiraceae bacterium]|nr:hypothetical protein [Lachnospiraceae bacterium]
MRKHLTFMWCLCMIVLLTACGSPKSANSLISAAKHKHGKCTVVSKTKGNDGGWTVVLKDDLQGFEYTVSSYMEDMSIDGSSFGTYPYDSDTFDMDLFAYVISLHSNELATICSNHNVRYDASMGELVIMAPSEATGGAAACECAEVIQSENLKNRMDGVTIWVSTDTYPDYIDNEHLGSVVLPDISFRNEDAEKIAYYTDMAKMQYDATAVYLRTEQGTFGQTGADYNRIANCDDGLVITGADSPVTFYYFKNWTGKEFYLCNFTYYDEEYVHFHWYSDY